MTDMVDAISAELSLRVPTGGDLTPLRGWTAERFTELSSPLYQPRHGYRPTEPKAVVAAEQSRGMAAELVLPFLRADTPSRSPELADRQMIASTMEAAQKRAACEHDALW